MVEHDTLVYSKNVKDTVSEDQRAIETFQQRIISGNLLGFHCPAICHFIERTVEKEGGSYKCHHAIKERLSFKISLPTVVPKMDPHPRGASWKKKRFQPRLQSKWIDVTSPLT